MNCSKCLWVFSKKLFIIFVTDSPSEGLAAAGSSIGNEGGGATGNDSTAVVTIDEHLFFDDDLDGLDPDSEDNDTSPNEDCDSESTHN